MLDLGTFSGIGSSEAYGINRSGQVVGFSDLSVGGSLIDPASGWELSYDAAINDHRQIAAWGGNAGVCQAVRLDLVSCVPEPQTNAMLLAGFALVGWKVRTRRNIRRSV